MWRLLTLTSWHNLDFSLIPRYDCMLMVNDGDAPHDLCIIWWSDADDDYVRNVRQHFSNIKPQNVILAGGPRWIRISSVTWPDHVCGEVRPPTETRLRLTRDSRLYSSQQEEIIQQTSLILLSHNFGSALIKFKFIGHKKKMQTMFMFHIISVLSTTTHKWIVYRKWFSFLKVSVSLTVLYCVIFMIIYFIVTVFTLWSQLFI